VLWKSDENPDIIETVMLVLMSGFGWVNMEGSSSLNHAGLRVSGIVDVTQVTGRPGPRAVVWARACPPPQVDYISSEQLLFDDGELWQVSALASQLTELHAKITGVIFPGYEPMAKVTAPASLADSLHPQQGWSVMANSESIARRPRQHGSVGQRDLLDRLGTLINESYIAACRAELFWPGSSRPGIHSLADRHVPAGSDRSTSFGINVSATAVASTNLPAVHSFRTAFHAAVTLVRQALTDPDGAAMGGRNFCGALNWAIRDPMVRGLARYRRKSRRPMRISLRASAAEVARRPSMNCRKR
jgi:hypothetical protein